MAVNTSKPQLASKFVANKAQDGHQPAEALTALSVFCGRFARMHVAKLAVACTQSHDAILRPALAFNREGNAEVVDAHNASAATARRASRTIKPAVSSGTSLVDRGFA